MHCTQRSFRPPRCSTNRDVGLRAVRPVHLDQIGPRLDAEVPADAEPTPSRPGAVETRPPSYRRPATIGAHDPTRRDRSLVGVDAVSPQPGHPHAPPQIRAEVPGPLGERAV